LPTTDALKKNLFDDRIVMSVQYGPASKYDPQKGGEQFHKLYQHQFPVLPVNECKKDIRKSIKDHPDVKVTNGYKNIHRTVCIVN